MNKINKSNAQHLAGMFVGLINRVTGKRYSKSDRGIRWFSTVAANLVAEGLVCDFLPFNA